MGTDQSAAPREGGSETTQQPAERAQDVLSKPSSDVSEGPLDAKRVQNLVEELYSKGVSSVTFPAKSERVARAELASQLGFRETEVAGHDEETTTFKFKFDPISSTSSTVQPEYTVGGGGGHKLFVKDASIKSVNGTVHELKPVADTISAHTWVQWGEPLDLKKIFSGDDFEKGEFTLTVTWKDQGWGGQKGRLRINDALLLPSQEKPMDPNLLAQRAADVVLTDEQRESEAQGSNDIDAERALQILIDSLSKATAKPEGEPNANESRGFTLIGDARRGPLHISTLEGHTHPVQGVTVLSLSWGVLLASFASHETFIIIWNLEERTNQKLADMEKKIDKLVRKFLPEDATTEEPNTTPALEAEGILDQITEAGEL